MNQSDRYFDEIFIQFENISIRPYSYEAVDHIKKGYRRCVYKSDSIYFRINKNQVEIMTIIGSQDLKNRE